MPLGDLASKFTYLVADWPLHNHVNQQKFWAVDWSARDNVNKHFWKVDSKGTAKSMIRCKCPFSTLKQALFEPPHFMIEYEKIPAYIHNFG